MIFNLKAIKTFGLGLFFLLLSSCSEYLKGKPQKADVLEIKQESMSCLKDVSLQISKFLKSETTNQDIDKTFNCFDQTLAEFQNKVEGREISDAFNADELFMIFDRFVKDAQLSKKAVNDLLVLKEALLGGSDKTLSKIEINQLREFLKTLKGEVRNLIPYGQVLSFQKSDKPFSKQMIQDGFAQLNLSLKILLKSSRLLHSSYSLEDFKRLINSLNLLESDNDKYIDLADKVNVLIRGTQDISNQLDREMYIESMTEALRLYSYQYNGYINLKMDTPQHLENSLDSILEVILFLENTVQYKKSNLIAVDTIDPILTSIHQANKFPIKLKIETALSFYKTLMVRVFQSGLHSDIQSFKGLERSHLLNAKREVAIFRIYSEFLAKISLNPTNLRNDNNRITLEQVREAARSFDPRKNSYVLKNFDAEMQAQIIKAVNEFKAEIFKNNLAIYRYDRLVIAVNQDIWFQNWNDLIQGLHYMMLSRLMLIGWGETNVLKDMKSSYLSEQGMVQWYSEFKNFGIETKAFDPRAENLGLNTLKAANLFTKVANADNKMDFTEAIEQISILVTAGATIPQQMVKGFLKSNCQLAEFDVFKNYWNNESCVIQDLYQNYKWYFINLPYLNRYLEKLSRAEFEDFYKSIMEVARTNKSNAGVRVETSDIRGMVTILHYIESLFALYDTNLNLKLSVAEIKKAYNPRFADVSTVYAHKNAQPQIDKFKSTIGYGCYSEQDLIRESFVFLVINQVTPKQSDFNLFPCAPGFHRSLIELNGEVDRKGIINTFKILKAVLGS